MGLIDKLKNKWKNLDYYTKAGFKSVAISVALTTIFGYGSYQIAYTLGRPSKVIIEDVNKDGVEDLIIYNRLNRGQRVYYGLNDHKTYISEKGSGKAIREENMVIIDEGYEPVKLELDYW